MPRKDIYGSCALIPLKYSTKGEYLDIHVKNGGEGPNSPSPSSSSSSSSQNDV